MFSLFEFLFQENIKDDLKKKFPNLAELIETELSEVPVKYLPWSVKQLSKDPGPFLAKEIQSLVLVFDKLANQNKIKNKDINSYKSIADLGNEVMQGLQTTTHGDEAKARRAARKEMSKQEQTQVLLNDKKYLVIIPGTWEDSCKLGSQPKSKEEAEEVGGGNFWCISNPYSKKSWDHYRQKGTKFIFINSKFRAPDDKYKLIAASKWPSGMIEYTDSNNDLITDSMLQKLFGSDLDLIVNLVEKKVEIFRN